MMFQNVCPWSQKFAGDLVYVLGETANELGASEYYEIFDKTGLNVPHVDFDKFKDMYKISFKQAIEKELVASCHAVARGGLGVHLSLLWQWPEDLGLETA